CGASTGVDTRFHGAGASRASILGGSVLGRVRVVRRAISRREGRLKNQAGSKLGTRRGSIVAGARFAGRLTIGISPLEHDQCAHRGPDLKAKPEVNTRTGDVVDLQEHDRHSEFWQGMCKPSTWST